MGIRAKLIIALLLITTIPMLLTGILILNNAEQTLTWKTLNDLDGMAAIQEARINEIIENHIERLQGVFNRTDLLAALETYQKSRTPLEEEELRKILEHAKSSSHVFKNISIVDLEGHVVITTDKDLEVVHYAGAEVFQEGKKGPHLFLYPNEKGLPRLFLSGPLSYHDKLLGVVVISAKANTLLSLTRDYSGLGKTGDTVLVKKDEEGDAVFIAPRRFEQTEAARAKIHKGQRNAVVTQALLKNENVFTDKVDYRRKPVLAATRYIDPVGWGLVLQIDKSEAYAPIYHLKKLAVSIGLIVLLLAVLAALIIARSISNPIRALQKGAEIIGSGNRNYKVGLNRTDEIGKLSRAFDGMTEKLQKTTLEAEQRAEALARSNAELEQFAYVASHDLQEPARKVLLFGDRLKEKLLDRLDEKAKEDLERMQNAAKRMQALIQDLLEFSRVQRTVRPFSSVDLKKVMQEVLSDLEHRLTQSQAQVKVGDLPVLKADPMQMRQLLQNLMSNALKFSKNGVLPKVVVQSQRLQNGFMEISVQDNGIGFDEKYLGRIFKPFQRLHPPGAYQGTGIGLTICHKIVERHGGKITANSQPGHGSTFRVTLPILK